MPRGIWSELLAELLLEEKGFKVIEHRHKVKVGREGVAEIDLIAEKDGVRYAVEVKSGKISHTDIRQVFTNAKLIGAKPLIIARSFVDSSSARLAEELGVETLFFPDYLVFLGPEDLRGVLEEILANTLLDLLSVKPWLVGDKDIEVLKALAYSNSMAEASRKLGISVKTLGRILKDLRERGVLTASRGFNRIRLQALIILLTRAKLGNT